MLFVMGVVVMGVVMIIVMGVVLIMQSLSQSGRQNLRLNETN